MSPQKSKKSSDLVGTPRFTLAFLKEALEFERESAEYMKKFIEQEKGRMPELALKSANEIVNQHRKNYKRITKQIESL